MKYKIYIDTNILMYVVEYHIDLKNELIRLMSDSFELIVIDKFIQELEKISINPEKKLKERRQAKLTKQYVEHLLKQEYLKMENTSSGMFVDDYLVSKARLSNNVLILTQDKELKARLKAIRRPVITIKQRKYLTLVS